MQLEGVAFHGSSLLASSYACGPVRSVNNSSYPQHVSGHKATLEATVLRKQWMAGSSQPSTFLQRSRPAPREQGRSQANRAGSRKRCPTARRSAAAWTARGSRHRCVLLLSWVLRLHIELTQDPPSPLWRGGSEEAHPQHHCHPKTRQAGPAGCPPRLLSCSHDLGPAVQQGKSNLHQ